MKTFLSLRSVCVLLACIVQLVSGADLATQQPRVRLVLSTTTVATSPLSTRDAIAVGEQGHSLFLGDPQEGGQIVLSDSNGRVLTRVGRTGSGPGEYRAPAPAFVGAGSFAVYDQALRRLTRWRFDGMLDSMSNLNTPVMPLAFSSTHASGVLLDSAGLSAVSVVNLSSGSVQRVVDRSTAFFAAAFPSVRAGQQYVKPIVGLASEGVLLGEPNSPAISWWSPTGVLIRRFEHSAPPTAPSAARVARVLDGIQRMRRRAGAAPVDAEQMRAAISSTRVPAVSDFSPAREDAFNRVWMLGISGDSATAYVFGRQGFVARVPLSCPGFEGRWALAGRWLALTCASGPKDHDGDAVLKLFKIEQ